MGSATSVELVVDQREQFQGVFSHVREIRFTVDPASIASNSQDVTTVSVPGMDPTTDVVLGWTHYHAGVHSHEVIESCHSWTDELHFIIHNTSGGALDLPSTEYTVIVGTLVS